MRVRDAKQKLEDQKSRLELIKRDLRQEENFNSMKSELAHNLVKKEKDEKQLWVNRFVFLFVAWCLMLLYALPSKFNSRPLQI